jgi:hypothetical protein
MEWIFPNVTQNESKGKIFIKFIILVFGAVLRKKGSSSNLVGGRSNYQV